VARPDKPIPAGLVPRRAAAGVATLAAAIGLTLAASCGPLVLALAAAGLVTGLAYDFRLKGTAWSWAPYAVGIPLLPVFAWVGSAGSVPAAFAVLVPVATLAGAALAIANAAADLERDRLGGTRTVATSLGPIGARRVGAALQGVVVAATLGTAVVMEGAVAGIALAAGGAALVGVGVGLGWHRQPSARSWEVQAIGLVALAAGWVASLAAAGRLAG
jgi:4-hydroxybenzoate polyprenyltransferase